MTTNKPHGRKYKYVKFCEICGKDTKFWTYSGKRTWECEECEHKVFKTFVPNLDAKKTPIKSTSVALFQRQIDFLNSLFAEKVINSKSSVMRHALDLYFSVFTYMMDLEAKQAKIIKIKHEEFLEIDDKIMKLMGIA